MCMTATSQPAVCYVGGLRYDYVTLQQHGNLLASALLSACGGGREGGRRGGVSEERREGEE